MLRVSSHAVARRVYVRKLMAEPCDQITDKPACSRVLGGGLVPSLISVTQKINWPDHEPAILFKSPRIAFCVR